MKSVTLVRSSKANAPTIGVLFSLGKQICGSLELPWADNKQGVSCIPEGTYQCKLLENHKTTDGTFFEKCFQVLDVPGRSGILIHPGNTVQDTRGCILLGFVLRVPSAMIYESKAAIELLAKTVGPDTFNLEIRSCA